MSLTPRNPLDPRDRRTADQLEYSVEPHTVVRAVDADVVEVYGGRFVPGDWQAPAYKALADSTWTEPRAERGRNEKITIDFSTTGLGGIVDGISRTSNADYLLWSFLNADGTFAGGGATRLPQDTTVRANPRTMGTVGSTIDSVTTGYSNLFTVGARILLRVSTTTGAAWNQATITAIDTGTNELTVDLDTALGVANESNTDLQNSANNFIYQLDTFQPNVLSGGVFESRPYALIGRVHTDGSGNVRFARSMREWIPLIGFTFRNISLSATNIAKICLGRWIPRWTSKVGIQVIATVSSVAGGLITLNARTESGTYQLPKTDRLNLLSQQSNETYQVHLRQRDCSLEIVSLASGTITISAQAALLEYTPEGRF